jgi:hypothetical protein
MNKTGGFLGVSVSFFKSQELHLNSYYSNEKLADKD